MSNYEPLCDNLYLMNDLLKDKASLMVSDGKGKEFACNAGELYSIPGSGRSPGEGNGNPLQYSCLENSIDRGAWQATVHGVTKSRTQFSE